MYGLKCPTKSHNCNYDTYDTSEGEGYDTIQGNGQERGQKDKDIERERHRERLTIHPSSIKSGVVKMRLTCPVTCNTCGQTLDGKLTVADIRNSQITFFFR